MRVISREPVSGGPQTARPEPDTVSAPSIVVRGRHTDVSDRFRRHVEGKLAGLDRLDHKLFRLDVEVSKERNPRLADFCERVEITAYSRGPVVRAEAAGPDAYAALDAATAKLQERLRRAAERRHSRGSRVAAAHAVEARVQPVAGRRSDIAESAGTGARMTDGPATTGVTTEAAAPDLPPGVVAADGPFVVREKEHSAEPMTLDDALAGMELVGHDFFLFEDRDSGCASVVYRRHAYHYGVLRLRTPG